MTNPSTQNDGAASLPREIEAAPSSAPRFPAAAPAREAAHSERSRAKPRLQVSVKAMDLRCTTRPLLVGHYDEDPISGAEAIIDRHILEGGLSLRYNLGMYAGRIGTATAIMLPRNDVEQRCGRFRGCIVTGLGKYDGSLTRAELIEAVRTAALRYLLHVLDNTPACDAVNDGLQPLELSSLLLGYNSSASLTITDAVEALIVGIAEANRRFEQHMHSRLRIGSLQIIELYLDTAISALYAAQRVATAMNADAHMGVIIAPAATLEQGDGMCHRLLETRGGSYWPRLIATRGPDGQARGTDDSERTATRPPAGGLTATDRIQFLYLGERARAESELHEQQARAIVEMVARQERVPAYQSDFSRSLFNLLLPPKFKDFARQIDRVILVVDACTANLPWELMVADDVPLVTKVAMVRQLASPRFRANVRQTVERRALVIGNPSTAYHDAPSSAEPKPWEELAPLAAAEAEATRVADTLVGYGFEVERAIGSEKRSLDVINALYRNPYRILHISAHGMYKARAADGSEYSGVVLSDGMLLSAAEFDGLEHVPELVFLNCCHLGKTDEPASSARTEISKLAHSVARELIEDGVRAVIAAGWAVSEEPGCRFAEEFYKALLDEHLPFGQAVLLARQATWKEFPQNNTWGAFQAYGDPAWRVDPLDAVKSATTMTGWRPVAPEQLLDEVASLRFDILQRSEPLTPSQLKRYNLQFRRLRQASEPAWLERADVHAAFAALYADLGPEYYERACQHYQSAIASSDTVGRVPISAIEQLALVEARRGEWQGDVQLIERAIERLQQLEHLVGTRESHAGVNSHRNALLGNAYRSRAAVSARAIIAAPAEAAGQCEQFEQALERATLTYERNTAGSVGELDVSGMLDWLLLLTVKMPTEQRASVTRLAQQCARAANAAFQASPDFRNAIAAADAQLAQALLDDSLEQQSDLGLLLEPIKQQYRRAHSAATGRRMQIDSAARQLELLALFHEAWAVLYPVPKAARIATRLRDIAQVFEPIVSVRKPRSLVTSVAPPIQGEARRDGTAELPDARPARDRGRMKGEASRLQ